MKRVCASCGRLISGKIGDKGRVTYELCRSCQGGIKHTADKLSKEKATKYSDDIKKRRKVVNNDTIKKEGEVMQGQLIL